MSRGALEVSGTMGGVAWGPARDVSGAPGGVSVKL